MNTKPFNLDDYQEANNKLITGELLINVKATGVVMAALAKISAMLRKKTDDMILSIFPVPFEDAIKRFLPIALKLDLFDYMLQGAWLQNKDDLFYQELDSEDWKLMFTMY